MPLSDEYTKYGKIVSELCKNSELLRNLELGAKQASENLFSTEKTGFYMKYIIEKINSIGGDNYA